MWKILHPFYAFHAAVLLSYLILHHIALLSISDASRNRLLKWEMQATLSLMIMLQIKFVRRLTWEAFLSDALLYSKGMVALLAFMLDWRLLAWYLTLFAILFLLFVQPSPEDQGKLEPLTPAQLEEKLQTEDSQWLVEFGAAWSPRCVQTRQLFTDLSVRKYSVYSVWHAGFSTYSKSGIHFVRIDLGRFPSVAAKYGIDFGAALRQIPTLIMFEGGNEVCRLPEEASSTTEPLTQAYVIHKFGLDAKQVQAMSRKSEYVTLQHT